MPLPPGKPFRVLSLGAGVQSTTLLRMVLHGDLPPLDAAIFADTRDEPEPVYRHLETLRGECEAAGLPLYIVSDPRSKGLTTDAIDVLTGNRPKGIAMCPFRNTDDWRQLKADDPKGWERAVAYDELVRDNAGPIFGLTGQAFVHFSGRPLRDVDLSTPEDHGQGNLFAGQECQGMCGI